MGQGNVRAGVLGGMLFTLLSIHAAGLLDAMLMAALGTATSFMVSALLRWIFKKLGH